ncbi:hypothetical protein [Silvimonas soli]|uniref:hypothetical protein n=1 Tax=Silvimonas soli TaxID=2980100 RepID=UPI0024B353B9|nr:hypothetical protein [Silvimonas soli]
MTSVSTPSVSTAVYRVDRFVVPAHALPAFMARVHIIDQRVRSFAGCKQNLVLSQASSTSDFNVVTIVEWESMQALAVAREAIQRQYAEEGFDPAAFMLELGVRPDMGMYNQA